MKSASSPLNPLRGVSDRRDIREIALDKFHPAILALAESDTRPFAPFLQRGVVFKPVAAQDEDFVYPVEEELSGNFCFGSG